MSNSLKIQAAMAPDFIDHAWPSVLGEAHRVLADSIGDIDDILLCGCGDSHHAALNLEFVLPSWTARRVRAAPAMTAARYIIPQMNTSPSRTLVIGISASGEVARTIEAIEIGNALGAQTLALTGARRSSLAEIAQKCIVLPIPDIPHGPGLLSYLASLLMGFAISVVAGQKDEMDALGQAVIEVPDILTDWGAGQVDLGRSFADSNPRYPLVLLGSGPAYGSALFAAAKVIEASGIQAWGQDVEEWSHLEYFCDPPEMPTWILRAGGRSSSREDEVLEAAQAIGRRLVVSTWKGRAAWTPRLRETLSPFGLWIGAVAFAAQTAEVLGEKPFRDFGGGRSQREGGGISRIRSSERITPDQVAPSKLK